MLTQFGVIMDYVRDSRSSHEYMCARVSKNDEQLKCWTFDSMWCGETGRFRSDTIISHTILVNRRNVLNDKDTCTHTNWGNSVDVDSPTSDEYTTHKVGEIMRIFSLTQHGNSLNSVCMVEAWEYLKYRTSSSASITGMTKKTCILYRQNIRADKKIWLPPSSSSFAAIIRQKKSFFT